jgi:hypothetical protein
MEYTQLGRSGLSVSRICLGTMNFGPYTGVEDSHAIMDRAHELGHQLFRHVEQLWRRPGKFRPHGVHHRQLVFPW